MNYLIFTYFFVEVKIIEDFRNLSQFIKFSARIFVKIIFHLIKVIVVFKIHVFFYKFSNIFRHYINYSNFIVFKESLNQRKKLIMVKLIFLYIISNYLIIFFQCSIFQKYFFYFFKNVAYIFRISKQTFYFNLQILLGKILEVIIKRIIIQNIQLIQLDFKNKRVQFIKSR